ncbi:PilZ domain-containing protein [Vibrio europaeus]|uniref:PilZ domain-containing protein n=1 Tax=Vibrio europaeus TaxID=300876 RepID=UPI00233EACA0|nr:PilZ domain-containing protein [Vibrio europaeus]MDC5755865.1 PilZ domain-containing protein [Vibrio europaeus]MDC5773966.1 PilZ domain-containing protein [Vibrio europaeus]MDC5797599.1 PilZ domain-containing protein [Vibrio europaeus]MDC5802978.1 PilZ domain-containing protein [Vibrio europaeus]MDC5815503.1 PilZ domain-containing protein [Vibrio europaeus]
MQQPEILSLAERLIPAYNSEDFEFLLGQMTEGDPPSVKILVKMELNRVMAPCTKPIDLRGRVKGECREYELDGLKHWLDDVAFNAYHKNTRKFGGYTEGVWEALCNTHNNFRVMQKRGKPLGTEITTDINGIDVEAVVMGYDLKRKENRLKISSQIEIELLSGQVVHAVTVDLSPSGAKFKVPSAFNYKLGEVIDVRLVELSKTVEVEGIHSVIPYRIVGIDESYENDAVKYLRLLKLDTTNIIDEVIEQLLKSEGQKTRHDNQDKIIRARSRGFEHTYLKHTCNLPVFFSGNELKLALMTENNQKIWQYWHDERNQQSLTNLFNNQRMSLLTTEGMRGSSNVIYSFTHEHQDKTLFFSMMMPEATRELRQLFWHIGAKKESWKVFRLSVFELSAEERLELSEHTNELGLETSSLTHCGILQEIADDTSRQDYLLAEKPRLASSELNQFRHARNPENNPVCIYFDAQSRRREPRYQFKSPIMLSEPDTTTYEGISVDISKHGISVALAAPCKLKAGDTCSVNFKELQLYDKKLPLGEVPYRIIRVSPGGKQLQLAIIEDSQIMRTIAFFGTLIDHNQDKLIAKKELLPSNELLEGLHDILLDKMVSSPLFIEKKGNSLRPKAIGINYPLKPYLTILAKLGDEKNFSLGPIYKGRTNTLLAQPMKRIEGAQPQYHELYLTAVKFGTRIQSVESKLSSDFDSLKERMNFVKNAQAMGEFYAIRICGAPVFDPITALVRKDLDELTHISLHHARNLEKDIHNIVGYGELTDITEEVLIRLGLTQ